MNMARGIDRLLDEVDWRQIEDPADENDGPYATHEGELTIAGMTFKVYVLNDGSRVFDADELAKALGA